MSIRPKKLDVMLALTDHLAGMTEAGGYGYDMAGRVYRGRTEFGDETAVPALSILEAPRQPEGLDVGELRSLREESWSLLLQGWVADDKDNPTDPAYWLEAYVMKRLGEVVAERNGQPLYQTAYLLGRRITGLVIGPSVVRPPQRELSDKAFFYTPLVVTLAVDVTDPFVTAS